MPGFVACISRYTKVVFKSVVYGIPVLKFAAVRLGARASSFMLPFAVSALFSGPFPHLYYHMQLTPKWWLGREESLNRV